MTVVNGFLLIDKPLTWTSFDVVNKVRYQLADELGIRPKSIKVGHAGTLDPLATGLLIVLVGPYTKRQSEFMKQDKTYKAYLKLGQNSDTDDDEGKKIIVSKKKPSLERIEDALQFFKGKISQIPPRFSAVKINGQPAYKKARSGLEVKLNAKFVTIYELEVVDYKYPDLVLNCKVSSGTYIRALARDLGEKLNTGAYLSGLVRTTIGDLNLASAISMKELSQRRLIQELSVQS